MTRTALGLFFLLFPGLSVLLGQQAVQFSQVMNNRYAINPAYAGMDYSLSITGVYRTQWSELEGAPETQHLNAHIPLYVLQGAGGVLFEKETLGAETVIRGGLSYNYVKSVNDMLWSVGLRFGLTQRTLDGTMLRTPGGVYEGGTINHNDPDLTEGMYEDLQARIDIGIYVVGNDFEGGISLNGAYAPAFTYTEQTSFDRTSTLLVYGEKSFYPVEDWTLSPVLFVKSDFKQLQSDVGLEVVYDETIFGGVFVRGYSASTLDALTIMAGTKLNTFLSLYYSYDLGLSELRRVHNGSHELVLNYNLGRKIGGAEPPKIIYSPRFYE